MKGLKIDKALVIGLGFRTGLAVSNFLASKGARVVVSDSKSESELAGVTSRLASGIAVKSGDQSPDILDEGFDTVVISPGVPRTIPLVVEACGRGIPVISEIELAYRYLEGHIIAITGTDGKSTTTALAGHILSSLGLDSRVGGNIGTPLISFAEETGSSSVTVVELSSFQLETIDTFRPHVAAMLNVSSDHMDRYDGMDEYIDAKFRIAMNQDEEDAFIYNMDDPLIASRVNSVRAGLRSFSLSDGSAEIYCKDGTVLLNGPGGEVPVLDNRRLKILGLHNVQNAMAAILSVISVLSRMGRHADYDAIASACYSFPGLEHRMERIGEFRGRVFINDSKATTVAAVETALRSLPGMGVIILGGRTKGDDYTRLSGSMVERVRGVVLIGESRVEFEKIFSAYKPVSAATLDEAVAEALKLSKEGDIILLSPSCASFDMFSSYEERGKEFKKSFQRLAGEG
jgi:UDP-N-acetylmuramoylalanine--D-glutamate ligase